MLTKAYGGLLCVKQEFTSGIRGKIRQVYQMKKFDVTDFLEILQECCMNIKQQKCIRIFRYHHLLLKYRAANFAI